MINDLVKENERVDDLQNGYYIIQDPRKFCFGMDAVLLSGFARVKKGEKVLDMGTGTGIIPVLLASKTVGEHFTGLEIQEECAEMAARSVKYNNLEDRVSIRQGDIKEAVSIFGATPDGIQGNVQSVNVLRQLVKVVVEIGDEKEIQEFPVGELKFRSRKKKVKVSEQELKELKDLEDKKGDSKLDD